MIKPFKTHDSSERGSSFSRRPILLAKLPRVGTGATPALDPALVTPPREEPVREETPNAHVYVDRGHAAPETIDYPQGPPAVQPPAPQSYYRHDGMHGHGYPTHHGSGSHRHSPGGIVQAQRLISSNSGLIVTLALTASAILLLLTIVNPPESQLEQGESYELYGSTPTEIPQFDHGAANFGATTPESSDEALDLFATKSNDEPTEDEPFDWDDAFHAAQEPESDQLAAAEETPMESASAELLGLPEVEETLNEEPIAGTESTPTDSTPSSYPQTKHPEFDLSLLSEFVEDHLDSSNSELSELPMMQGPETLNR